MITSIITTTVHCTPSLTTLTLTLTLEQADITLNWIPYLGPFATSIINLGVFIANFVLGTATATITAAIAWIFYRPLLGFSLLAGAIGLLIFANKAGEKMGSSKNIKLDD